VARPIRVVTNFCQESWLASGLPPSQATCECAQPTCSLFAARSIFDSRSCSRLSPSVLLISALHAASKAGTPSGHRYVIMFTHVATLYNELVAAAGNVNQLAPCCQGCSTQPQLSCSCVNAPHIRYCSAPRSELGTPANRVPTKQLLLLGWCHKPS
jgi:hypothetical protein